MNFSFKINFKINIFEMLFITYNNNDNENITILFKKKKLMNLKIV